MAKETRLGQLRESELTLLRTVANGYNACAVSESSGKNSSCFEKYFRKILLGSLHRKSRWRIQRFSTHMPSRSSDATMRRSTSFVPSDWLVFQF